MFVLLASELGSAGPSFRGDFRGDHETLGTLLLKLECDDRDTSFSVFLSPACVFLLDRVCG